MQELVVTQPQPDGWTDEQLSPWPEGVPRDDGLVRQAMDRLNRRGWYVVDVADPADAGTRESAQRASAVVAALARPIKVFGGRPTWKALTSDPRRPAASSGGVGAQPLHLDFVNAKRPPDLVFLYCLRSDPGGGGASVLSGVEAIEELSHEERSVLQRPLYRDGVVENLEEVGEDLNPFAVWNPHDRYRLRWTGKLLESTRDPDARAALRSLRAALESREEELALRPGQMLVVNQRRAVHGRRALGTAFKDVPRHERRLLMHGFGRWEE